MFIKIEKRNARARFQGTIQGEVIGIDLNEWSMNANDGVVSGERIFDTSPGREDIEKYNSEKEKLKNQKVL